MNDQDYPSAPPPEPSTIDLMRQVSTFQMQRTGITPSARSILKNSLGDYTDRVRLHLAILGTHRMRRMARILAATDMMEERLTDPAYLDRLARLNPIEFRKTFEVLLDVIRDDREFLRSQSAETAEKEGFSRDPSHQFKMFFEQKVMLAAENMTIDERRRTKKFIDDLFALVTQTGAAPPPPRTRVLEGQPVLPPPSEGGDHGGNGTSPGEPRDK